MIIACESCQTRFKVGDEKFAHGPIRVRCSKCNHVFLASGTPSQPPGLATQAPVPAATGTPGPITGIFAAASPGAAPSRSGIFRAPPASSSPPPAATMPNPVGASTTQAPQTIPNPLLQPSSSSLPPTAVAPNPLAQPVSSSLPPTQVVGRGPEDPFRGLDAFGRRPTPGVQPGLPAPDPFAPRATPLPRKPSDPFARGVGTPAPANAAPANGGRSDPFGFGPAPSSSSSSPSPSSPPQPSGRPDPFAGLGTPSSPPAPTSDPFAGLAPARSPTKDPFAGLGTPAPDPFGASSPPSPASAAPFPDPFASTEAFQPQALMGGASPSIPPPSVASSLPPAPMADPFGLSSPPADSADSGSSPPPPPGEDPFGGLDGEPADASSLFGPPGSVHDEAPAPPPAPPSQPPAPAGPAPEQRAFSAPPPTTGADMQKLRRAETAQRVRDVVLAAGQGLLLGAFIAVAVVVGRGGTVADVLHGDWRAALGGPAAAGALVVEDAHVSRRTVPAGFDVVVVTGTVVNTGDKPVPAARVDVRFGDGTWQSGWAWSNLDGVDVDGLGDPGQAQALSLRGPRSPAVQPGDHAPFVVVVAPAPAEGLRAQLAVTAAVKAK